jgi:hypothetical protein
MSWAPASEWRRRMSHPVPGNSAFKTWVMLVALGESPFVFARAHSPPMNPYMNADAVFGSCGTGLVSATSGRATFANRFRSESVAAAQSAHEEDSVSSVVPIGVGVGADVGGFVDEDDDDP